MCARSIDDFRGRTAEGGDERSLCASRPTDNCDESRVSNAAPIYSVDSDRDAETRENVFQAVIRRTRTRRASSRRPTGPTGPRKGICRRAVAASSTPITPASSI